MSHAVGFTTREIDQALLAKGFRKRQSHHSMYILYQGELKTSIRTRLSHGHQEYGDALLGQMARQMGLSRGELNDFIRCPLTRERYLQLLTERGRVQTQQGQRPYRKGRSR